jgi:hypothetical protein
LSGHHNQERWLELLSTYALAVADRSPQELARGWDHALRHAAGRARLNALEILAAVRPMTRAIGGVEEEYRSVVRVRRWWP